MPAPTRARPALLTHREFYYPSPGPGVAAWLTPAYTGMGMARAEIISYSADDFWRSDVCRYIISPPAAEEPV